MLERIFDLCTHVIDKHTVPEELNFNARSSNLEIFLTDRLLYCQLESGYMLIL